MNFFKLALFPVVFALWISPMARAQSSIECPKVAIDVVELKGATHLPEAVQEQLVASLKHREYEEDSDWIGDVRNIVIRAETDGWPDRENQGYIGFSVEASWKPLRRESGLLHVLPKLSDFFDCCSVFGQRGENQSGFGVTAGQKWFECAQRSERTTLGGTCCRSRPRSAEVVRHLSISTSVLIPVDDQSACERLAW